MANRLNELELGFRVFLWLRGFEDSLEFGLGILGFTAGFCGFRVFKVERSLCFV